jgi:peptide deformylase
MSLRRIRVIGDPVLGTRANEVVDFDRSLRRLVHDLADTMVEADGVGLAAPQIGVLLRVFTYLVADREDPDFREIGHIVNPVLVEQSTETEDGPEGCLSIPGIEAQLPRPRRIVARGFSMYGDPIEVVGTERVARCLAHETDHLDGILFIDRLDPESRRQVMAQLREATLSGLPPEIKLSPHQPLI